MMMMHMMAQFTGAIFHIRRGDTSIFIRCAEIHGGMRHGWGDAARQIQSAETVNPSSF